MPDAIARLFFALWPDDVTRAAVASAVSPAVREVTGGRAAAGPRAVPVANYHFTLAFLGAVATSEIAGLSSVAAKSAAALLRSAPGRAATEYPLSITLDTLEHWRKPQVLVATASITPHTASALAGTLTTALIGASFTPDAKPFRPHLTLVRKLTTAVATRALQPVTCNFTTFALVESRKDLKGSSYTVLESFPIPP